MRKKPRNIEDEELDEFAKERAKAISDLFPDERLKSFGLTMRECCFVRAYCVLLNAKRSALIAGYTNAFAISAYQLLRKEDIKSAVSAVMAEAVNPVTERQTLMNVNTTISRLMQIVRDTRDAKASVMASKALLDYLGSGLVKTDVHEDSKKDDVPDEEISASLARMGVLANG